MNKLNISDNQSNVINLIRGVAAQLVLVGHLLFLLGYSTDAVIQNLGVVAFFVLSGHLITVSALRLKTGSSFHKKKFFCDRFLRIYVALIPALFVCFVIDYLSIQYLSGNVLFNDEHLTIKNFIFSLLNFVGIPIKFLAPYVPFLEGVEPSGTMRPLWTVTIEWWLYIALALIFIIFRKVSLISIILTTFILLMFITQAINDSDSSYYIIYIWLLASLFTLLNGQRILSTLSIVQLLIISIALVVTFVFLIVNGDISSFYEIEAMLLITSLYFIAIYLGDFISFPKFLSEIARFLSLYSYSLYLLHYTLICFFVSFDSNSLLFWVGVYMIINFISYGFYNVVERHHLTFRRSSLYKKLTKNGQTRCVYENT